MKTIEFIKNEITSLEKEATESNYRPKKSKSTKHTFLKTCYHYLIDPNFTQAFLDKEIVRVGYLVDELEDKKDTFPKDGSIVQKKCRSELLASLRKNKLQLKALLFIHDKK